MLFITNKYTTWYYSIINTAKNRTKDGYTERHHIIPKSLGGTNAKDNLVHLTAREHFICHRLLTKMTTGEHKMKMVHAVWNMVRSSKTQQRYKINSKVYEFLKQQKSQAMMGENNPMYGKLPWHAGKVMSDEYKQQASERNLGEKNPFYGQHHSAETKAKISAATKNRVPWNKGKTHSAETKAKMSADRKGRTPWNKGLTGTFTHSDEARAKMSASQKGRVFSDEHRLKLSLAQKGKPKSEETKRKLSEINKAKHAAKQQGK